MRPLRDTPVTLSRREVIEILGANGLRPSRALGQNFVVDANTVRRVVRLAQVQKGDHVLEVGAGLGALSLALVEAGCLVTAVERDPRLVALLRSSVEPQGVTVVEADALTLDWRELLGRSDVARWALVANLPYNVATPLVVRFLEEVPVVETMLVMVQREVAERLAAGVGDPAYGAVSVKLSYWAEAAVVGRVPQSVFYPRPRVESALVRLVRRSPRATDLDADQYERLFSLVREGFGQRRKMLRRSLGRVVAAEDFSVAGVDPGERPEDLDLGRWRSLAGL
jgi:16S rRNA (adenine1518-N6/adenine1519-N6)-dimethyltransferase